VLDALDYAGESVVAVPGVDLSIDQALHDIDDFS
jgi:hypothetical protein